MFPSNTANAALNAAHDTEAKLFYNNMFSLHGAVMVFMFIIPAVPAVLGNFILPMMLGAKDVAFPRLNLMSFYIYLIGAGFVTLGSSGRHVADSVQHPRAVRISAWTPAGRFTRRSAPPRREDGMVAAVAGVFILGFSSILTGVNFIATMHKLRPRGMTWFRMPLFLWALYATGIIQILATPVLAITLLLLLAEETAARGDFRPVLRRRSGAVPALLLVLFASGGLHHDPAGHGGHQRGDLRPQPQTYLRLQLHRLQFGGAGAARASWSGATTCLSAGQSNLADSIFSLLTFSVAIPSAVKVFNWLATLYAGSIRFTPAMLYALGFILLFTIGGLTGLFLGALDTDVPLHDTYFVVAHFHYVMVGSMVFAFLGGMYHWWPKISGKMYNQNWGRFAAVLLFVGFNLTFFPQFIMGTHGMPRRWATYPAEFQTYHIASTIGAYIMAISLITVALNWLTGLLWGRKAPANPWGGNSLEWHTPSPPPHDNFLVPPVADDPYNLAAWEYDASIDGWVRARPAPAAADRTRPVAH